MEKGLDETAAKEFARLITTLMAAEKPEKTPLELVEERIVQLNRDIKQAEGNRHLQKQLLLQLKTAMRKRDELLRK